MSPEEPVIKSFLDTDLYKLTMQSAIHNCFPDAEVSFDYHNRTPEKKLTVEAIDWLKKQIKLLGDLRFAEDEIEFLKQEVPFLPQQYFKWLETFKLHPDKEVIIDDDPDHFDLRVKGAWDQVTLYEIPLLALVSEAYFRFIVNKWTNEGQFEKAKGKSIRLCNNSCAFSEFGTRRRRSFETQKIMMEGLMAGAKESNKPGMFLGTSNVYFAKIYKLKPMGTIAHEWMMGIAAITQDYNNANKRAMDCWLETVGNTHAGLALTDTFGTDVFLRSFYPPYSDYYAGVRQDSGDPLKFIEKIGHHYIDILKLPKFSKSICFSDSLNVDRCIQYKARADEVGMNCSFGIGTNLTNDFADSTPMNIVMKIDSANGHPAVKISDNLGKNTGDPAEVRRVKKVLGYEEKYWAGGDEEHRWG
ncbi:hypothetical protein BRETT_004110 [Brettanomyces bruxellensis]|uniref:Nicotinate phosphoribosyltransferase n=1 Tax=Dekkera bruxellensis TaxID=5007 RepID=A0A871R0A6_DEKBR|nr:uncharacterized protein BRETT_004110 [Brettanomyces bruxellensis]QOU18889.1 hypothetical protein BRETT_004110 [Brettanomyces bruxellensis]